MHLERFATLYHCQLHLRRIFVSSSKLCLCIYERNNWIRTNWMHEHVKSHHFLLLYLYHGFANYIWYNSFGLGLFNCIGNIIKKQHVLSGCPHSIFYLCPNTQPTTHWFAHTWASYGGNYVLFGWTFHTCFLWQLEGQVDWYFKWQLFQHDWVLFWFCFTFILACIPGCYCVWCHVHQIDLVVQKF